MSSASPGSILSLLTALTACMVVSACDPDRNRPLDPRVPDSSAVPARGPALPVSEHSGKPSAPVRVDYRVAEGPAVGKTVEVELEFTSSEPVRGIQATYRPVDSSALSFADGSGAMHGIALRPSGRGRAGQDRFRVIPHRGGRHLVNVLVEVETDSGSFTEFATVPITVASSDAKLKNDENRFQKDTGGQPVISLPADESGTQPER
ncbi:hypothetical protein ACXYTJ_09420 [Gilvimarinus sp. F26214L]|uniref:hypothetical protein n=1 Tax=Gilvimarinus sp. DZF01 TaxID=3461371 RepID=UPI0040453C7E